MTMQHTDQPGNPQRTARGALVMSLLLGLLAVAVGAYRLNDWRYFLVGDEYGFYPAAQEIVRRKFSMDPFSSGVHVMNYMAVSFYQALFLALKPSFWMWRFSNILLFLPICVFVYIWGKTWFAARVGMLATVFVATSFFLHNYFLIGYPNPLAVFFLCALHAAWGSWSTRDSLGLISAICLGCLTGISYYVYLGPLLIVSVAPYVLYKMWRLRLRPPLLGSLVVSALCTIACIMPGLLHTDALNAMLRVTSRTPEFSEPNQILVNIQNCFRIFWWNPRISHFISGRYIDRITLSCLILGLVAMSLSRRIGSFLLVFSFCIIAVLVGATSPYSYPATTRGVVFLPFGCLAAAIGFDWLTRRLPPLVQGMCTVALFGGLVVANIQRAEAFHLHQKPPTDLVFMRDMRLALARCPSASTVRAFYPEEVRLMNGLPNLSFFMTVQVGRPITIVRTEEPPVTGGTPDPSICDFHFDPRESIARETR
jgi:hypothetical protein